MKWKDPHTQSTLACAFIDDIHLMKFIIYIVRNFFFNEKWRYLFSFQFINKLVSFRFSLFSHQLDYHKFGFFFSKTILLFTYWIDQWIKIFFFFNVPIDFFNNMKWTAITIGYQMLLFSYPLILLILNAFVTNLQYNGHIQILTLVAFTFSSITLRFKLYY